MAKYIMATFKNCKRAKTKREPKDKMYARIASLDRTSFYTMATSYDIHERVKAQGHKPYFSHISVARE